MRLSVSLHDWQDRDRGYRRAATAHGLESGGQTLITDGIVGMDPAVALISRLPEMFLVGLEVGIGLILEVLRVGAGSAEAVDEGHVLFPMDASESRSAFASCRWMQGTSIVIASYRCAKAVFLARL